MLLFIYCRTSLLGNIKSFQYISCYSLSEQGERTASVRCRFNTSHVTLYLQLLQTCIQTKKCFNTSHVTLYHKRSFNFFLHNGVSIHLMLLFIRRRSSENAQLFRVSIHLMLLFISKTYRRSLFPNLFQYISCYSLSSPSPILLFRYSSFNTSHVTLYLSPVCRLFIPDVVSIHLMLLFILWQEL